MGQDGERKLQPKDIELELLTYFHDLYREKSYQRKNSINVVVQHIPGSINND